jgi:hypothetical protein
MSQECHFLTFGILALARANRLVRVAASALEHSQNLKKESLIAQVSGAEIKGLSAIGVRLQRSRALDVLMRAARELLRMHQFVDEIAACERGAEIEIISEQDLSGRRDIDGRYGLAMGLIKG